MLKSPTFRARHGVAAFKSSTVRAWSAWAHRQTVLINELRLDLSALRVRQFVLHRMDDNLFGFAGSA
ncbi:putative Fe(2+)-trafficking protein [Candidatus Tremblaya princeps]|uniref:Putative Fe(2+)-trafficking protein n=1 Tax=Tremblaya princeps TaxID=189385 RepID=A0A143WMK5_TREPR|nr:putative Fe(2+)-trafficking protein [Candidatus Tremblaya princeps]